MEYLSKEERNFLENFPKIYTKGSDKLVYETKFWLNEIKSLTLEDVYKILKNNLDFFKNSPFDNELIIHQDVLSKLYLIVYYYTDNVEVDSWFLISICEKEEIDKLKSEIYNIFYFEKNKFSDLVKYCDIAYPVYYLSEYEKWKSIHENKSNFILSEQQEKIILEKHEYPLFIDGRAGSGKSTILQYLFLESILKHNKKFIAKPIYISYTDNLIYSAKNFINNLYNENYIYSKYKDENDLIYNNFDDYFFVFKDLALSYIVENNENAYEIFSPEKYINYIRFKKLWSEKFAKNLNAIQSYGPEISWHVIRTYIKGWDIEKILNLNDYLNIGSANQSVTLDTYKLIFNNVWIWYNNLQKDNLYWDDQDLIRFSLKPINKNNNTTSYVYPRYCAVFCDEVQDFTRIEIKFILKISIYPNKIVDLDLLKKVPFVFAGDEFQTINPTGFRWDLIRSYFTEQILCSPHLIDQFKKGVKEPIQLIDNYRSTHEIVKFSNLIQLLRNVRCIDNVNKVIHNKIICYPQYPYFNDFNSNVIFLNACRKDVWERLFSIGAVLIVPIMEGQSIQEYIESTSLNNIIEFYSDGSPKGITIYSPFQAKGLDYPYVAIFGYDFCNNLDSFNIESWLRNPKILTEVEELEIKYFLNNLYVCITRARNNLYILSDNEKSSFWDWAIQKSSSSELNNSNVAKILLNKIKNYDHWVHNNISMISLMENRFNNQVIDDNIISYKLSDLKIHEDRGMDLQDSGLLLQAASRYRENGLNIDERRCQAYGNLFINKFLTAAELFESIKYNEEAIVCYRLSLTSYPPNMVIEKLAGYYDLNKNYEVLFSYAALSKNISVKNIISILQNFINENFYLQSDKYIFKYSNILPQNKLSWECLINNLIESCVNEFKDSYDDIVLLYDLMKSIHLYFAKLNFNSIAKLVYDMNYLNKSIEIWETDLNNTDSLYFYAKAQISEFPDNIKYYDKSQSFDWFDKIFNLYKKNKNLSVDINTSRLIEKILPKIEKNKIYDLFSEIMLIDSVDVFPFPLINYFISDNSNEKIFLKNVPLLLNKNDTYHYLNKILDRLKYIFLAKEKKLFLINYLFYTRYNIKNDNKLERLINNFFENLFNNYIDKFVELVNTNEKKESTNKESKSKEDDELNYAIHNYFLIYLFDIISKNNFLFANFMVITFCKFLIICIDRLYDQKLSKSNNKSTQNANLYEGGDKIFTLLKNRKFIISLTKNYINDISKFRLYNSVEEELKYVNNIIEKNQNQKNLYDYIYEDKSRNLNQIRLKGTFWKSLLSLMINEDIEFMNEDFFNQSFDKIGKLFQNESLKKFYSDPTVIFSDSDFLKKNIADLQNVQNLDWMFVSETTQSPHVPYTHVSAQPVYPESPISIVPREPSFHLNRIVTSQSIYEPGITTINQNSSFSVIMPRPILIVCESAEDHLISGLGAQALCSELSLFIRSLEPILSEFLDCELVKQPFPLVQMIFFHAVGVLEQLAIMHRRSCQNFRSTLNFVLVGEKVTLWLKIGKGLILRQTMQVSPNFPCDHQKLVSSCYEFLGGDNGEVTDPCQFLDSNLSLDDVKWGVINSQLTTGFVLLNSNAAERVDILLNRGNELSDNYITTWLEQLRHNQFLIDELYRVFDAKGILNRSTGGECSITLYSRSLDAIDKK